MSQEHIVPTIGGTLLSIIVNITGDIIRTAILAVVGATVSYLTSLCIKCIRNRFKRKK